MSRETSSFVHITRLVKAIRAARSALDHVLTYYHAAGLLQDLLKDKNKCSEFQKVSYLLQY